MRGNDKMFTCTGRDFFKQDYITSNCFSSVDASGCVFFKIAKNSTYCRGKKEGGIEGYHSNGFDFLHHRRYFLDTHKGLISRSKLQKTIFQRLVGKNVESFFT